MSERETVVELPWTADSCPWVGKLRTVLPISDVIRDIGVDSISSTGGFRMGTRGGVQLFVHHGIQAGRRDRRARECAAGGRVRLLRAYEDGRRPHGQARFPIILPSPAFILFC
jgi:hypothetical protein